MMGTAIPAGAGSLAGMGYGQQPQHVTASMVNSFRVAAVADKLAAHAQTSRQSDAAEFYSLCLSLARGVDYAVANNEVPPKAHDLPLILKQISRRRNDPYIQAGVMVLMISVKNACKLGWFSDKDSQELVTIANEIGSTFSSSGDISIEQNRLNSSVASIMARFYPLMQMGQILACLKAEPGYGAYAVDFHISKNTTHSPKEKILLFVASTDNMETSACIISPQEVSFLLNGRGVEKRTNVLMDFGPQMPTNVTTMLKYGTNLLQAVGQFNSHYIIAVAFMSMRPPAGAPKLLDYVQSGTPEPDLDSEVIEGPSRISLCCPISRTRIRLPVKGHSCKHLQCFDFSNYVDINSRRPSWRCPHCNQFVCYSDIRIDQNTVKVLKEMGEEVADVIISADGTWKAFIESDDHMDSAPDKNLSDQKDGPDQQEPTSFSNAVPVVLDLTGDDNAMDVEIIEINERKPLVTDLQRQSSGCSLNMQSNLTSSAGINQNAPGQLEDDFWAGFTHILPITNTWSNPDITTTSSAMPGGSIPPALNQEAEVRGNFSTLQNQFSTPNNIQMQQVQYMNQLVTPDYGRMPSIPRNVTRPSIAVQALPIQTQTQTQTASTQQRSRNTLHTSIPNGSYLTSQAPPVTIDIERQQPFSRSHMNPPHVPGMSSSPSQNLPPVGIPIASSGQLPSAYAGSSYIPPEQSRGQSVGMFRSSSSVPQAHPPQDRFMAAAQRALQMGRQSPTVPIQMQTPRTRPSSYPMNVDVTRSSMDKQQRGNTVQTVSRTESLIDLPSDPNWQPSGRMRGSITPGSYSAALDPIIIRPTQSGQPTRPPIIQSQATRSSVNMPSPILKQRYLSNIIYAQVAQTQSSSMAEQPVTTANASGMGMRPDGSSALR